MIASKHLPKIVAVLICACLLFCGFIVYAANTYEANNESEYQRRLFNGDIVAIDIRVNETDWQELLNNAAEKEYISGDLTINGEMLGAVGIRSKGNLSIAQVEKSESDRYSLNIKMDMYTEGQTYYGLDTFCLNNLIGDPTYMKEYLAYEMMRYIGVPSPLTNFANVTVNGEDYGFMLLLERYDKAFLGRVFNTSAGQLYNVKRMDGDGGSLIYTGNSISSYPAIFENVKFNNKSDKHEERVITAIRNLNEGNNLEEYFDVDTILRYFAAHTVVVNLNSYSSNKEQNYYLYVRDGVVSIIPWSYHLAFGGDLKASEASIVVNFPIDTPVYNTDMEERPLLNNLLEVPEYREKYYEYLRQIIDGYWGEGLFEETIRSLDTKINTYVENDVSAFYSYEQYKEALVNLIAIGNLRSESIAGQLNGTIPSTTEGQNADDSRLIDASSVNFASLISNGRALSNQSTSESGVATDSSGSTIIVFNDNSAQISGSGADFANKTLTINRGGTYELSESLNNGQIVINADKSDVIRLVLNNVSLHNETGPAIYAPRDGSERIEIILASGTNNTISDGAEYTVLESGDDPSAAIYVQHNLDISGDGTLTVTGNHRHGIRAQDFLTITGGTLNITAQGDALRGRDGVEIHDGILNLIAGGDGIQSNNANGDEVGFIIINGGTFNIKAVNDGIQAESSLTVNGGTFDIFTGGGSANAPVRDTSPGPGGGGGWGRGGMPGRSQTPAPEEDAEETESMKGLKAKTQLTITGGNITIDAEDDGLHSDGDVFIHDGRIEIRSGDDGIHADKNVVISGGEINIPYSYEGIEGLTLTIHGGNITVYGYDDGLNVAGNADGSPRIDPRTQGGGGRGMMFEANDDNVIRITGGTLDIFGGRDGIDSNGHIYIEGGSIKVSGQSMGMDGAIEQDGNLVISGGEIITAGSFQSLYDTTQPFLYIAYAGQQAAGSVIEIKDTNGTTLLEYTSRFEYSVSGFTSPLFEIGKTYSVFIDGNKIRDVELTDMLTQINESGSTGNPGRPR